MSIKSILLSIDNIASCEQHLKIAVELANQYDSDLCGLYVKPHSRQSSVINAVYSNGVKTSNYDNTQPSNLHAAKDRQEELAIYTLCERYAERLNDRFSWHSVYGSLNHTLAINSYSQDLIIVGQKIKRADLIDKLFCTAAIAAVNCACPVLMLPHQHESTLSCQRPLIVWDGSLESSRALRNTLFLLRNAQQVQIFIMDEPQSAEFDIRHTTDAVLQYLNLYDIHPEKINSHVANDKTNKVLLSHIQQNDNDLIIMGAYEHARLHELTRGDFTREILNSSPIPVLLSH